MKRIIAILLLSLAGSAYALPNCPSDQNQRYDNCFGTYTFANGDKYVGEFKDGKRNGQGTYTYANGDKYVGEWKADKRNGQGTYTYADGEKYVGQYKDGKYHGQGTYTYANGDKYVGEWKDGKQNGYGTATFASGEKYVGEWKDGKKHVSALADDMVSALQNKKSPIDPFKKFNQTSISMKCDNGRGVMNYTIKGDTFIFDNAHLPIDGINVIANKSANQIIWKDASFPPMELFIDFDNKRLVIQSQGMEDVIDNCW